MIARRLVMDTDYHDLTYVGKGTQGDVEALFDRMAEAGFGATTWDVFWCGTAVYHSARFPVFTNRAGWPSAGELARVLQQWDPLAHAVKLGNERGIRVLAYFRLLEEAYAPFDGHEFFREHPEYWWQSRCGLYRMVGWPCYNYPEVRAHMMTRVDDLAEHGVTGALFDLARSHVPYFCAYRWGDGNVFGFNAPVVEEFRRRYGVDLSTFSHVEEVATADHGGLPFVYERRWMGTEPYDVWAFRRLLGEGFELFLREVRDRYPQFHIAVQAGVLEAGGRPDEAMEGAICRINLEDLCAEGVVDELSVSQNYRGLPDLEGILLPRFQHVRDSGRQLTAWLNDFFTADGGGGAQADLADVRSYVNRFLASDLDGAVIHEAAFLLEREDAEDIWAELARLGGGRGRSAGTSSGRAARAGYLGSG